MCNSRTLLFQHLTHVSYLKEDFGAIATACGLTHVRDVNAFVSKVMVFDQIEGYTGLSPVVAARDTK
jgi:hypothetical protein